MKSLFLLLSILISFNSFAQNWSTQASGTIEKLESVFMINENEGWICGDAGVLLRTSNGGVNWTQVNITNQDLADIAFKDAVNGILIGDDGFIQRTTNGGATWSFVASGTGSNLAALSWSGNNIFISGRDGVGLVSTNDGASFSPAAMGTTARFRGAAAFGTKFWAVGENGIIRFSSNTGSLWQSQASSASNDLHDIQFLTTDIGFAGGSGSTIIYSSNGGQTWMNRSTGINSGINGIYFLNENTGWAASDAGIIYKTTNGGLNWINTNNNTVTKMNEAFFINEGKGWAVGDNGVIIHFFDASVPVELTSFTASVINKDVTIAWVTSTEVNNKGFELMRMDNKNEVWRQIGFVAGSGTTTEVKNYSFVDKNLEAGNYKYKLVQFDFDGTLNEKQVIEVDVNAVPDQLTLNQNYPNPFNPSTIINYQIPQDNFVTLKVYNLIGEEMITLVSSYQQKGNYSVRLVANKLSSGIYFYKLQHGSSTITKKMTLKK